MTREDLEQEIAQLRAELSGAGTREQSAQDDASSPEDIDAADEANSGGLQAGVERMLSDHGISTDDLGDLWEQLRKELADLPEKKPLVTAVGAFALGFMAGRISKK